MRHHLFVLAGLLVVGLVIALAIDALLAAALVELREWRETRAARRRTAASGAPVDLDRWEDRSMSRHTTASCYLTISRDARSSRMYPRAVITNMTKGKPKLRPGELAVKVNITLPQSVFQQHHPEIDVVLPEDQLHVQPQVDVTGVPVVVDQEQGDDL